MYVKLCYFLDSVSSQWNQQQYNCVNIKKSRSQCVSLTEKVLHRNNIIQLNDSQGGFYLIILNEKKQGKSEGFDSCDQPSNLTQTWFKSLIFQPIWPRKFMDDLEKQ